MVTSLRSSCWRQTDVAIAPAPAWRYGAAMLRLGCAFALLCAACSSNGTGTGMASLTGASPAVQSAYSKSFMGEDGSGTTVLGWKIVMLADAVGTGCELDTVKIVATV